MGFKQNYQKRGIMDALMGISEDDAPEMDISNITSVDQLQNALKPSNDQRKMAFWQGLFNAGTAMNQGQGLGAGLAQLGASMQAGKQPNQKILEQIQTRSALQKLLQKPMPTRRETTLSRGGKYYKGYEDVDPSTGEAMIRDETLVPIADPTAPKDMTEYQQALLAFRQSQADAPKEVKPLSASLQKLQDDRLQEISDLYNRATPLSESMANLSSGKLKLNAVSNLINQGVGAVGLGGEEADSLAQFKSALEGLAVDQSNLAKGVQTDKDFERSRRSILENINNESYVKKELPKLIALNNKRRKDRQALINKMRRDQGQPEMTAEEFSAYGGDNVIPTTETTAATGWGIRPK
jgi:hypothetical protein